MNPTYPTPEKLVSIIDEVLALMQRAKRVAEYEMGRAPTITAVDHEEYLRSITAVEAHATVETLVALVRHYESRLVQVESESARFAIMKDAIRAAIKEEK